MKNKTKIIGILNITDDSFSDGGKYLEISKAINHIKTMILNGCCIIDIGAESTKPGFKEVSADNQLLRILPIINEIKKIKDDVKISVDTRSSVVAELVLKEGATIINDVSGGKSDKNMFDVIAKYKAEVILYDPKTESRESMGEKISIQENRTLIRPYDDIDIIAGQGTAGKEIYEQLMQNSIIPDIYLCCCGGGGLIAGTSTYLRNKYPDIKSYSAEPFGFDDTKKSLKSGKILSNETDYQSICDAIITPQPGNVTFPINLKNLEGGLVVTDEEVKNAIKFLSEHLKIIVEPGGAVAATAALTEKINLKNKTVVVMISGGNIDLEMFRSL